MTDQPPGNYPPPPEGGYPPPPPEGGYPPPPPEGGYPPPPQEGGYPPPPSGGYPPPPPPQGGGYPPPPGGYPPPQGGYPPPQGGYPPPGSYPSQGGYPPPPPPGQGGYPPQPYGYGQPGAPGYGAGPQYSVGEAFSWAWNKFSKNAVPLIVATLVFGLILAAVQVLTNLVASAVSTGDSTSYLADDGGFFLSYDATGPASTLVMVVGWILALVVGAFVQSAYLCGVLDIANGREVEVGSFFRPRNVGNVVIAAVIVGFITSIGYLLCIIPGIIASIFLMFTVVALLDRDLSPIDAIKTSFDVSKSNFGSAFLAWAVMILITLVGALLCGVGLLVAVPLAVLILVYTFRRLTGAQVAPLTP